MAPSYKADNLDKGRFQGDNTRLTVPDDNYDYDFVHLFHGMALIETFYGDSPDEDEYLESALIALRKIGNVHRDMYGYTGYTDGNGEICMPVKAMSIEFVTDAAEDWTSWSVFNELDQLYPTGGFVKYKFVGDRIVTDRENFLLSIAYRTYKQGEDGLPMVTEREAEACAHFWKYVDLRKKMYRGDQLAGQLFPLAKRDYGLAFNRARLPNKFSQNFMDSWLDTVYSRDRKLYNRPYKPHKL